MQEGIPIPHWMQLALTALASTLSGIGIDRIYNTWLNRRKPAVEVDEIAIRASSSASEAVIRMMDRLDGAQLTIDRLRQERDDLRLQLASVQDDAKASQLFTDQLNAAAKLTTCEHYPNGVKLSNYLPRQLNPPK